MTTEANDFEEPVDWSVHKRSCQRYKLLEMFAAALEAECPTAKTKYQELYRYLGIV